MKIDIHQKNIILKNDLKSQFLRLTRYMIHKFLFFLPFNNKLNNFFNVRPCLNNRLIFKK